MFLQTTAQMKISISEAWGSPEVLCWGSSCFPGSCQSRSRNRIATTTPEGEGRASRLFALCYMIKYQWISGNVMFRGSCPALFPSSFPKSVFFLPLTPAQEQTENLSAWSSWVLRKTITCSLKHPSYGVMGRMSGSFLWFKLLFQIDSAGNGESWWENGCIKHSEVWN